MAPSVSIGAGYAVSQSSKTNLFTEYTGTASTLLAYIFVRDNVLHAHHRKSTMQFRIAVAPSAYLHLLYGRSYRHSPRLLGPERVSIACVSQRLYST